MSLSRCSLPLDNQTKYGISIQFVYLNKTSSMGFDGENFPYALLLRFTVCLVALLYCMLIYSSSAGSTSCCSNTNTDYDKLQKIEIKSGKLMCTLPHKRSLDTSLDSYRVPASSTDFTQSSTSSKSF